MVDTLLDFVYHGRMIKSFQDEHRWLSNFAPVTVVLDGVSYESVEHAYQAAKTTSREERESIRRLATPGKAKRAAKFLRYARDDFNEIRVEVMAHLLAQKFRQEPYRTLLLETGDSYIQEGNNWNDKFWGVDLKSGDGLNVLGALIMNERCKIREEEEYIKRARKVSSFDGCPS